MKKRFLLSLVIICLFCTACNGDVTRDLRHAGFSVGNKFICDRFYPHKKEEVPREKIVYMTGNHIINGEGKIYEISMSKVYANNENCKEADTSLRVKAIMNNNIIKALDGKYYYLTSQSNVESYSEVPVTDNSYLLYDILLKDDDVVKVVTANGSTGLYYVLKTDGNVYGNVVISPDRQSPPKLISTQIVYSKSEYGSRIIDFNYAGNSLNTFLKTEDTVYRMKITNATECNKYADIECKYEMQEDPIFVKYKDRIISYNGSTLITDYKIVFSVSF